MSNIFYSEEYGFRSTDLDGIAKALMRLTGLLFEEGEKSRYNGKYYDLHDKTHGDFMINRNVDVFGDYGSFNPWLAEFKVILQWDGKHPFPYRSAILALTEFSPELIDIFIRDRSHDKPLVSLRWSPEQNALVDISDS
ncbi:MAG: hypothetical protein KIT16_23675 [Rhodospirillaceae bacterium]|nr:hypothetical protein [Rhodospirillaceae bacterium]